MKISGWRVYVMLVPAFVVLFYIGLFIMRISKIGYAGLASAAFMGAGIGLLIGGFAAYYDEMRGERITLSRPKVKQVKPTKRSRRLDKVASRLAKDPKRGKDVLEAGVALTPHAYYYRWVQYGMYSLIGVIPAGVVLAFILKNPLPLAIVAVPVFVMFYLPTVSLKSAASDRKRAIEDELPFFALYAAVMADAGVSLYRAMKRLVGRGMFKYIERDAVYLERSVEFMGEDEMSAIDALARNHPSKQVRDFLFGYSSELRSGGNVAGYFADRAASLLQWLQFRFESYGDSVSDMGEMMVAIFFILPTLVIASAFISPSTSITLVWLMSTLVVPIMGVMIVYIIKNNQPRTGDVYIGSLRNGIIAGAVSGVVVGLLHLPLWAPVAAASMAGSLAFSIPVYMQKRAASEEEASLEGFIRDITEYRKSGYHLPKTIVTLASEGKYTKAFTALLKGGSAQIQLGNRLSEIPIKAHSWLVREMFFLLGEIDDSGGGTPKEFETIHEFVEKFMLAKRKVSARMRMYEMLTMGTPPGLAVLIFAMSSFIKLFRNTTPLGGAGLAGFSGGGGLGIINTNIPPNLFVASYTMVITSAIFMALSAGVASDFTIKNMWRVAVVVLVSSIAIFILTTFGGAISSLLPTSLLSAGWWVN